MTTTPLASPVDDGDFWKTLALTELSTEQWERLCDGCGWCCLHKLEDKDSGMVYYTRVACDLLDIDQCRCRDYSNRRNLVPDCRRLTPVLVGRMYWLPPTCAYRRRWHHQSVPWWHHLNTGDRSLVHRLGKSVRSVAIECHNPGAKRLKRELLDCLPWENSMASFMDELY